MAEETTLLIVGAGPFGLSLAAYAQHYGIDHIVLGKPMEFWEANMPARMYLRSACDWHLDPFDVDTIEAYLETQGLTPADVEPLSLQFYLGYTRWFQEQKQLKSRPAYVQQLDYVTEPTTHFEAHLDDETQIYAKNVVLALGFGFFKYVPPELAALLPADRFSHTCDLVDFTALREKRCLIVGGRQSAFEWAALLNEAGAAAVHVVHRHATPAFTAADWTWVNPLVDAMVDDPGWFRTLSPEQKEEVNHRLWAEGRLKVEPWLWPRLDTETVRLWPNAEVATCGQLDNGELAVNLNTGDSLRVDHVILATGYKVDMRKMRFLAAGNVLDTLDTNNNFPILDEAFQTNIPGLFVTSMPATQDFGPFFGFTIAVRTSARLIGRAIRRQTSVAA